MQAAYDTELWHDFFVALAGAAAALTGLLFVAVSINIERILAYKGLTARGGTSLALLVNVLLVSAFGLTPQSRTAIGVEIAVLTVATVGLVLSWQVKAGLPADYRRHFLIEYALCYLVLALLVVGGVSLAVEVGGGLYWVLAGITGSLLWAVVNAWVLLVEILR